MKHGLVFLLALILSLTAYANEAQPLAENPAIEARLLVISEELRCLVCQNESLAGSRADLALDLRREIRILIAAGKTDADIMEFMVSRYGDFVRYRPPVNPSTWLLWFGPLLLFMVAMIALFKMIRSSQCGSTPLALDAAQQKRVEDLLKDSETPP